MGIMDDLDSINKNLFMNNKRKQDNELVELEYGSFQALMQIVELLKENNVLLKSINNSIHNSNDIDVSTVQGKRNSGLQNRNKH